VPETRHYHQWEIWDVDWKHEDGTSKRRPALLISSTEHNRQSDELWFVKVSSVKHNVPYCMEFHKDEPSFTGTGLTKTSYFYIADVRKISKSSVFRRRGAISPMAALLIDHQIRTAIGLTHP
jgi:mRNA-degrading endonuclease toxin of MazEF toxin-antitoxin module